MNIPDRLIGWAGENTVWKSGRLNWRTTGRQVDPSSAIKRYPEYVAICQSADDFINMGVFFESLIAAMPRVEKSEYTTLFPTVETKTELIYQALEVHGLKLTSRGDSGRRGDIDGGDDVRSDDLENIILKHRDDYEEDTPIGDNGRPIRTSWTTEVIRRELRVLTANVFNQNKRELRTTLTHAPEMATYTHDYLSWYFGVDGARVVKEDQRLAVEMFKHWLWQTKRYLYGQKVPAPIMLNILGEQETGKTLFVRRLSLPFDGFDTDAKLYHALDDRESERWMQNYIIRFDELAVGGDHAEFARSAAGFKALLTMETINYRVMRETKHHRAARTFSPIATSNKPLADVLYDPTGMRRFYEIVSTLPKCVAPWQGILAMEPVALWQGIDENLPLGYVYQGSEMFPALQVAQAAFKRMDLVELTLKNKETGYIPIYSESVAGDHFVAIYRDVGTTAKREELEKLAGVDLIPPYKIRGEITQWMEDEKMRDSVRFLPNNDHFISALKHHGVMMIAIAGHEYVVCQKDEYSTSARIGV